MNKNSSQRPFVVLDFICIAIIIIMTGYTFYAITQMPDTIPIHSTRGVTDGWGSKWISLLMPGFIVLIYLICSVFSIYLKKRNQSITITKWAGFGGVVLFAYVNLSFIQFALS